MCVDTSVLIYVIYVDIRLLIYVCVDIRQDASCKTRVLCRDIRLVKSICVCRCALILVQRLSVSLSLFLFPPPDALSFFFPLPPSLPFYHPPSSTPPPFSIFLFHEHAIFFYIFMLAVSIGVCAQDGTETLNVLAGKRLCVRGSLEPPASRSLSIWVPLLDNKTDKLATNKEAPHSDVCEHERAQKRARIASDCGVASLDTHRCVLQCAAVCCSVASRDTHNREATPPLTPYHCADTPLQHTATHCSTLQHTATHCNTPTLHDAHACTKHDAFMSDAPTPVSPRPLSAHTNLLPHAPSLFSPISLPLPCTPATLPRIDGVECQSRHVESLVDTRAICSSFYYDEECEEEGAVEEEEATKR